MDPVPEPTKEVTSGYAVEKAVVAHSGCWAKTAPKRRETVREQTTLQRWHAVHDLLNSGVGLLDCSRRVDLALNTVKRYARAPEPDRLRRPPQYRACLVDPYREHLRARRAAEPGVPVRRLLDEIKALGYTGSSNLLYRYVNERRLDGDRIAPSARRLTRWIMTRPTDLPDQHRAHLDELLTACPEMTALAHVVREFAQLMTDRRGADLDNWINRSARHGSVNSIPSWLDSIKTTTPRSLDSPPLQQRPDRGREHEDETDQATDVRTRRVRTPTAPNPPGMNRPEFTATEIETEPKF